MEYNKNTFCKANDKKVLHKIRKHWVVVSTALLMALGGGGAAATTHVSAHADANNNNGADTSSTDTIKENLNQKLQAPQQNNAQSASNNQSAQAQNSAKQASADSNTNTQQLTPSNILKAAANLHGAILGNAAQNGAQANDNAAQQNQSQQSGNGFNAPKVNNNGAKANTTNPLKGVAPKMQVGQSNPADQTNANNNKVDFTRPRVMLGAAQSGLDQDGLYKTQDGYSWNSKYSAAQSDWEGPSDYNSDDGSESDFGRILIRYVDPSDGNYPVGTIEAIKGIGSDYPDHTPDLFTTKDLDHYLKSVPPLMGPYGTGYTLKDSSNIHDPANIDSGSGLVKDQHDQGTGDGSFVGGKDLFLTINVTHNKPAAAPGQIAINYINNLNGDTIRSQVLTDSDNASFSQQGFIDDTPYGWDVDHWNTEDIDPSTGQPTSTPGNTPITKYDNTVHPVLNVYVRPDTSDASATVHYIDADSDASEGDEVGSPRTIYGNDTTGHNGIDFDDADDYVPSGYSFDGNANGTIGSYNGFTNGHAGSTVFNDDNSAQVYVAVTKNSGSAPSPEKTQANLDNINVVYKTSDGNGGLKPVGNINTVGKQSDTFNPTEYEGLAPDGYSYDNSYNKNEFENGLSSNVANGNTLKYSSTPGEVDIYVKQTSGVSNEVSNDKIQYMSIDPNDPNAEPQTITDPATHNYTFPIYGAPGTKIDYDQYTSNPPKGYVYAGRLGTHSNYMNSNQTNVILVESTDSSSYQNQMGTVVVTYKDVSDGDKAVDTTYYHGMNNTSFDKEYWRSAKSLIPSGYGFAGRADDSSAQNFVAGQTENATILVHRFGDTNPNKPATATATIQYDEINPNEIDPSTHDYKVIHSDIGSDTVTGNSDTPINYAQYIQNVPANTTFYTFGTPVDTTVVNNHIDHLDVISSNFMPSPIHIRYVDQSGQDVDKYSSDDPITNEPKDYNPLIGNDGQTFNFNDIQNNDPIPQNYMPKNGDSDITVTVSNHPQTINIPVVGNPDTNTYPLNIHRVIKDSNGQQIGSDVVPVTVKGVNYGDILTYAPSDYTPSPRADYTSESNPQQIYVAQDGLYTKNGDSMSANPVNSIEFDYQENVAQGTVLYEATDNHDQVVGTKIISDVPNQDMSSIYSKYKLTQVVPTNFMLDTQAANANNGIANSNNSKFLNGNKYVIYVKSSNTQSGKITPRAGYGYITVNYETKGTNGQPNTVVATELASGKPSTPFNESDYEKDTPDGMMPDAYTYVSTTGSDAPSYTYDPNNNQVFNVIVKQNPNDTHAGQLDTDQINYIALDSDDNQIGDGPVQTVQISGIDGTQINYTPYTDDVPSGYYYDNKASEIPDYTFGMDSNSQPIATIYVKKTSPYSHNTTPGYDPTNTSDIKGKNGQPTSGTSNKTYDPTHPGTNQTGNYLPWNVGNGNSNDAPLDGPENSAHPITQPGYTYNGSNPKMPKGYEYDQNGVLPIGYLPAWVPETKGVDQKASDFTSGYVPSDYIPDKYVPGFVPNGKGGYVPGYVPDNPNLMPSGKGQPKYVPGQVPNGKGGTTPGLVPDKAPYATNTSANLTIQYVDAQNHKNIIQTINVQGAVGSDLDLSSTSASGGDYLYDLPVGYTLSGDNAGVLGEYDTTTNNDTESDNAQISNIDGNNSNKFTFSDTGHTIQIAVNQKAVANVIYEASDNSNAQVGSSMIDGYIGQNLNFNQGGADYKYMQLLPYGYTGAHTNPATPILNNGGTYVIYVHSSHVHNAPSPQSRIGTGYINIVYRDANNQYDIGSDALNGKVNTPISSNPTMYTTPAADGGAVPYGYNVSDGSKNMAQQIQGTNFTAGIMNPITINVTPNGQNNAVKQGSDVIEYRVLEKDPSNRNSSVAHTLVTGKDGNLVPSDDTTDVDASSKPVTFTVTGANGSTIDYSSYQNNVPSGYFYNGMGSHSTIIDAAHNSTANPDVVYISPAPHKQNTQKNGTINVHYVNDDAQPGTNNDVDNVTVNGYTGDDFNTGYYEDNVPEGYVYNNNASSDVVRFTSDVQSDTIHVVPKKNNTTNYGVITVHYIDANSVANGPSNWQEVQGRNGSTEKTIPNLVGSIFNSAAYFKDGNVPMNYHYDRVLKGGNIHSFGANPQDLYIAVDPD